MNYSTAIFLVNQAVRAVAVSYDTDAEGKGIRPFTLFKTLDPDVEVGQYVVIPTDTRHRMTVARVEEVDVDVDLESTVQVGWLVDAVDRRAYDEVIGREANAIGAIKSAERRAKQEELREKLIADNPELQQLSAVTPDAPALPAPGPASAGAA